LFTKILKTTDKVVTKFLEDSKVEEKIDEANTAHNFFSNQVYGKSMLEVILKIDTRNMHRIFLLQLLQE